MQDWGARSPVLPTNDLIMFMKTLATAVVLSILLMQMAQAAVELQKTRIVIEPGAKEDSITIKSADKHAALVQSWISDSSNSDIDYMTALPALTVVNPNGSQQIRVIYQGQGAAQDRETLAYLNIQDTSAISDEARGASAISPTVLQVIKVFYRPDALVDLDALAAPSELKWTLGRASQKGHVLHVENPTPFHIVFQGILLAGPGETPDRKKILSRNTAFDLLPPFSSRDITLDAEPGMDATASPITLLYMAINDFGMTEAYRGELQDGRVQRLEPVPYAPRPVPQSHQPSAPQAPAPALDDLQPLQLIG